jgi:hypothetical protein
MVPAATAAESPVDGRSQFLHKADDHAVFGQHPLNQQPRFRRGAGTAIQRTFLCQGVRNKLAIAPGQYCCPGSFLIRSIACLHRIHQEGHKPF